MGILRHIFKRKAWSGNKLKGYGKGEQSTNLPGSGFHISSEDKLIDRFGGRLPRKVT